jgi:alkanesulfonate monooxygenase SsuD/methylene tetrahydromethanopterin reductase-like flavin-dependent oxidoreductase (luciferase family)
MVRFAIGLPNVGEFGDPTLLTELAVAAEEHGWDGVYLWDHLLYHDPGWPVANPTVTLSAIAARTHRIRLGILMTALPRRRVQTVAKETEYTDFGEDPDLKIRAAKLDRGLDDLTRLWQRLLPPPVQRPRIPIWCPGRWPTRAGFRRAARWDGAMPTFHHFGQDRPVPPSEFAQVVDYLAEQRGTLDGYDIALEGRAADGLVDAYTAAGMTWWIEAMGWWRGGVRDARATITAGPPR